MIGRLWAAVVILGIVSGLFGWFANKCLDEWWKCDIRNQGVWNFMFWCCAIVNSITLVLAVYGALVILIIKLGVDI